MPNSILYSDLEYKFTPARLRKHEKTGYCIVFDVKNPTTGKFQRCRRKLNELRKLYPVQVEFKAACEIALHAYNQRLSHGWNPLGEDDDNKIPIADIQMQVQEQLHAQANAYAQAQAQVLHLMTQAAVQGMGVQPMMTPIAQPVMQSVPVAQPIMQPVMQTAPVVQPVAAPIEQPASVAQPIEQPKEQPVEVAKPLPVEKPAAPVKAKAEVKKETKKATPIIIPADNAVDEIEQRGLITVKECLKKL